MRRLTQAELEAAHRIFNHVDTISGGYYGRKTQAQVRRFVSLNRWIMFPPFNVNSLREGTTFPAPNVYVSFHGEDVEEIRDDGNGRIVEGYVGVTYNNVDSMLWLDRVLKVNNAAYFIKTLNSMGVGWDVNIEQKIKTNHQDNTPVYRPMDSFCASTVTVDQIKDAIDNSRQNELNPDIDDYDGEPVLWCVTVFGVSISTSPAGFDMCVKEAFDLFIKVLSLR